MKGLLHLLVTYLGAVLQNAGHLDQLSLQDLGIVEPPWADDRLRFGRPYGFFEHQKNKTLCFLLWHLPDVFLNLFEQLMHFFSFFAVIYRKTANGTNENSTNYNPNC
jgi:hypothetical protein